MNVLRPDLLWLALVAPLLVVAAHAYAQRRRRQATGRLGSLAEGGGLATGASARRRRLKTALVAGAALCFALALARPRYGTEARDGQDEGLDLVVALDVSKSMLAEDLSPSRLEKAKAELGRLLDGLRGDRVGLVLFAGDAFVQAPLTSDYGALRLLLDVAGPDALPTPGTDFGVALDAALDAFGPAAAEGTGAGARVVLFVSDGENHVANLARLKADAEERGVTILAAGMGEKDGAKIPDPASPSGFKQDGSGQDVVTRLEDAALRDLASGRYVHVGRSGALAEPVEAQLGRLQRAAVASDPYAAYAEQFAWPLLLGVLLLLADLLIDARRRGDEAPAARPADVAMPTPGAIAPSEPTDVSGRDGVSGPAPARPGRPALAVLGLLAALVLAGCGPRGDGLAGNRAYAFGDYDAAAARYASGLDRQNAAGDTLAGSVRARLLHNLGLALLASAADTSGANPTVTAGAPGAPASGAAAQLDSLARRALDAFARAFALSPSDRLRQRAAYHGGLAGAALGDDATALDRFRTALLLDGKDEDAAYNWEFIARNRRDDSGGGQGGDGQGGQDGQDGQAPPQNPGAGTPDGNGQTPPPPGQGEEQNGQNAPDAPPQDMPNGDGQDGAGEGEQGSPGRLSREEARRILDAVGQEEGRVRRDLRTRMGPPERVEKDW